MPGLRLFGTPEQENVLALPGPDALSRLAGGRAIRVWGQSVTLLLAAILFLGALGCSRSEPPQFVPPPSATPAPTPVITPIQAVPTPRADDSAEEDHSDTASSATSLRLFSAVDGSIDYPGDVDLFVFEGVYGLTFEVEVDAGTLVDGVLTIYGSEAECVLARGDQLVGQDQIVARWRSAETASYYVSVEGAGKTDTVTGTYTLRLTTTSEEPDDDHGDLVCSATTTAVGQSASGVIEHNADVDVFEVELSNYLKMARRHCRRNHRSAHASCNTPR